MKIAFYRGQKKRKLQDAVIYLHQKYMQKIPEKHSQYTHCEFLFTDGVMWGSSGRDGGVRGRQMTKFKDHWDFVEVLITKKQEEKLRKWCEARDGAEYDMWGIIFCQALNTNWFLKPLKWFCSEYNTAGLQHINMKAVNGVSAHMISPARLHMMITGKCDIRSVVQDEEFAETKKWLLLTSLVFCATILLSLLF